MSEREAAAINRPKCPKCGTPDAARLMGSDMVDRWQCRNFDCLEQFTTPRERSASAIIAEEKRRRAMNAEEVAAMAAKELECSKCGEEQKSPRSKGQHERFCTGKKNGRAAQRRSEPTVPTPAAAPMALIPIVNEVPEHLKGSDLEPAVQRLLDRRAALEKDLAETNGAIAAVSKLEPRA